jgi:Cu(I)/Ag(I) efflux system membrane fusion protein
VNNKLTLSAIALVLLGVGAAGGYWWAAREPHAAAPPEKRKVLYWHDPMVPGQRFDKPGKSPFMDMQLVPVYADEASEGGDVRVNPSVVQNLGIRLGRVERATLDSTLRLVGNVAFDERLLEVVQARADGYVTRLHVKAPLERVRRGQPLADILSPQWLEAEQEYLALLDASADRAQPLREAARQRLVVLGVPDAAIKALETTRKASATTTLVAPLDGIVTELGARQGAAFMAGARLFRINGLSTVWVNARVPEAEIPAAQKGAKVEVRATAWPGSTFKGEVTAILPEVDPQTRTLTARISIENENRRLTPGMYVTLELAAPAGEPQLVVPSEALIRTGTRNVVIVAREDKGFDIVSVTPGAEHEGRTAILSGLTEGQSIVLSGQFLIDSEASLRSVVNRLGAEQAP